MRSSRRHFFAAMFGAIAAPAVVTRRVTRHDPSRFPQGGLVDTPWRGIVGEAPPETIVVNDAFADLYLRRTLEILPHHLVAHRYL